MDGGGEWFETYIDQEDQRNLGFVRKVDASEFINFELLEKNKK